MFCKKCGNQLADGAVFCPTCGAPTANPTPQKVNQQPAQPQYAQPPQPPVYQQPVYQQPPVYVQPVYVQQPPKPAAKKPKPSNAVGMAGFVLSLVSFVLGEFFLVAPIIGFICSVIGVAKRKNYDGGNGLAVAGLVINIIQIVFWLIILLVFGTMILAAIGSCNAGM